MRGWPTNSPLLPTFVATRSLIHSSCSTNIACPIFNCKYSMSYTNSHKTQHARPIKYHIPHKEECQSASKAQFVAGAASLAAAPLRAAATERIARPDAKRATSVKAE